MTLNTPLKGNITFRFALIVVCYMRSSTHDGKVCFHNSNSNTSMCAGQQQCTASNICTTQNSFPLSPYHSAHGMLENSPHQFPNTLQYIVLCLKNNTEASWELDVSQRLQSAYIIFVKSSLINQGDSTVYRELDKL